MTTESPTATSDLLQALTDDVSNLVRQELQRAQDEMVAKARQVGMAGALLAASGALGGLAAGTSAVFVVRALDATLPPRSSALLATALFGAGAAGLGAAGLARLRSAGPMLPQETLAGVRNDLAAVRR